MRIPLLALPISLLLTQPLMAQLDDPGGSCFEPVQPACSEVTVGSEDEGWALRCREELTTFQEDLASYQQCVVNRIETMRARTASELERISCMVEQEQSDAGEGPDCD